MAGILRTRKVLSVTLAGLLLLTGLLYGVYALVLPRAGEKVLREKWAEVGLPGVTSMKVESVTPWGMVVRDVTAPGIRVGRLMVGYDLGMLRAGRVGAMELEGLELMMDWKEGEVRGEVIDALIKGQRGSKVAGAEPGFASLGVRGEVLLQVEGAGAVRLPLGMRVTHDVAGKMQVEAEWEGLPLAVKLRAEEGAGGDWQLRVWPAGVNEARFSWVGKWKGATGELVMEPSGEWRWGDWAGVEAWLKSLGVEVEGLEGWELTVKPRVSWGAGGEYAAEDRPEERRAEERPAKGLALNGEGHVALNGEGHVALNGGRDVALNGEVVLVVKPVGQVKIPGAGLVVNGVSAQTKFAVRVDQGGLSVTQVQGQLDWQKVEANGANVGAGRLAWQGEMHMPWWGKSKGAWRVNSSELDVTMPSAAVVLEGVKLDVPMSWGNAEASEGSLVIDKATWMGESLGRLNATVRCHAGLLQWESPWPVTGVVDAAANSATNQISNDHPNANQPQGTTHQAGLFTQGALNLWGRGAIEGQCKLSLMDFRITDGRTLGRAFPTAGLEIVHVTGQLEVHGVLTAEGGRWKPWVTLYVREGAVGSVALQMEASGVEAKLDLEVLGEPGPGSPPFQWMMVKQAQVGQLRLRDGLIQFQMQTPQSFLVERTRWTMGEKGRFWVHSFWMDPTSERIELEVFLEDVNLRDLFEVTAKESVAGDGLIYGRIPVMIYPDGQPMVRLGQGFLYGRPGRGWVEIKDRRMIDNLMREGGVSVGDQIKERFVTALSDFEYTMMRMELLPQELPEVVRMGRTSPVLVRLTIEGKGRQGTNPIEFSRLTINLNGIEDLLDLALRMQREREGMGR